MSYRAIGFDYGGVIKSASTAPFLPQILTLLGLGRQQFLDVYYTHNAAVHRGEITWDELWQQIATHFKQPEKGVVIAQLFRTSEPHALDVQMLALVDTLRAKGFKVGLLSNNPLDMVAKMRREAVDTHFDVFHISGETGLVKPEPQAFRYFAEALGVQLAELIFIDDSPQSLSTAGELGYTPILFTDYKTLTARLRELKILTD